MLGGGGGAHGITIECKYHIAYKEAEEVSDVIEADAVVDPPAVMVIPGHTPAHSGSQSRGRQK